MRVFKGCIGAREGRLESLRKKPTGLSNLSGSPSTNGDSSERRGVSATSGPSTDGERPETTDEQVSGKSDENQCRA
ncbi:MAG: hypothetical protein KatS3mg105_3566 [Gemmatales bacterium]|nr:MAG: hypothetical protein KatS3mg105_3566 [Gemmatales bacterium]